MVKALLTDIKGNSHILNNPISLYIIKDRDAPADGFYGKFISETKLPELKRIEIIRSSESIFCGCIDEQTDIQSANGTFITIRARSIEAVLLDNEAFPQTYHLPSFDLIFERHFRPLGFTGFTGSSESYNGELIITKGMSEWAVLSKFCGQFIGCKPDISSDGIIDISGTNIPREILLTQKNIKYLKHTISRRSVISDICARTYPSGSYDMHFKSSTAEKNGIQRQRYLNITGTNIRGTDAVKNMIDKSDSSYQKMEMIYCGFISCEPDDIIKINGDRRAYKIKEIQYNIKNGIEEMNIFTEVNINVDQHESKKQ